MNRVRYFLQPNHHSWIKCLALLPDGTCRLYANGKWTPNGNNDKTIEYLLNTGLLIESKVPPSSAPPYEVQ